MQASEVIDYDMNYTPLENCNMYICFKVLFVLIDMVFDINCFKSKMKIFVMRNSKTLRL